MLLTTGCVTTETKTRTVVPAVDWPVFPDPAGIVVYDDVTDMVSMPLEFYERIYEYKLRVDEAERVYLLQKEIFEKDNPEK